MFDSRLTNQLRLFCISIVSAISISGCEPSANLPTSFFSDYIKRIASVQKSEPLDIPAVTHLHLPAKRDLRIEVARIQLGLLESYELRKCGLFNLIAERNSILGKVQDDFRLLEFQIRLINGLKNCINSDQIGDNIKTKLNTIHSLKTQQFSFHLYNLIYTSQPMRRQLSGSHWLDNASIANANIVKPALAAIHHYKLTHLRQNQEFVPVVPYQEVIEKEIVLGPLLFSLTNSALYLDLATKQLERFDNKILCGKNRDETKLKRLINVFKESFIKTIQPYLASLDSIYQRLLPELGVFSNDLFNKQIDLEQPPFPIDTAYLSFKSSTKQHVSYWQSLFARCGMNVEMLVN